MRMKQKVMTAVYNNNNNRVKCKQANWAVLQANLSANQANRGLSNIHELIRVVL